MKKSSKKQQSSSAVRAAVEIFARRAFPRRLTPGSLYRWVQRVARYNDRHADRVPGLILGHALEDLFLCDCVTVKQSGEPSREIQVRVVTH